MLQTYKTILSQKQQLTNDVSLFRFQLVEPKEINFKAGQYLILKIADKSRLYSIASPDFQKDSFKLVVELVPGGLASTYLSNLKVGEEAIFQGPAGMFVLKESPRRKIFLATGTGIAPIRSILISNIKYQISKIHIKNQKFYLFWGLRTYQDIYLLEELKQLALNNQQFQFHICLSRQENLEMIPKEDKKYFSLGHVNEVLEKMFHVSCFMFHDFDFYLCGSRQVVESLRQYLEEKGIPKGQVFFEKF